MHKTKTKFLQKLHHECQPRDTDIIHLLRCSIHVYIGTNLKKFIDLQHTFFKILLHNIHGLKYKVIISKYTNVFLKSLLQKSHI